MTEAGVCGYPDGGCDHPVGGRSRAESAESAPAAAAAAADRRRRKGEGLNGMSEWGCLVLVEG